MNVKEMSSPIPIPNHLDFAILKSMDKWGFEKVTDLVMVTQLFGKWGLMLSIRCHYKIWSQGNINF